MRVAKRIFLNGLAAGAIAVALFAGCKTGHEPKAPATKQTLPWREAFDIATEAYIFGYPLIMMDMTRSAMTNVREPEGTHAPMGQFARTRTYPPASNHDVTIPNTDTLYTTVWLDVSREPWVLSIPDTKGRYALFPMLDGWTTVFQAPGKRTTGSGPQKFAITGPGWKGKLPRGLKEYKSPTSIVWVLGRIYCTGTPEDYAAVHAMQDQCSATPLSAYGKPYTPPPGQIDPAFNTKKSAREQISKADAASYFNRLAALMKENPPTSADARILKRMARLGIVPGRPFDISRLDPEVIQALQSVPKAALDKIMASFAEGAKASDWIFQNGWRRMPKTGAYGTDYTQRALMAAIALGVNRAQDTVFAVSSADGTGQPYTGKSRYVMHFAPGKAPSANGFWSLTMYDGDYFFVDNPLGRYTLSARDSLKFNSNGSLDFYIQRHPPGTDRESNWLPAPEGKFVLMLRFYWPKEPLINGSWQIPPVKRTD
jgi:hypothetical protein